MIFLKTFPYNSERNLLVHSPDRHIIKNHSEVGLFLKPYSEAHDDRYMKPETPIFFKFSEEVSDEGNTDKEAESSAESSNKSLEGSVKSNEGSVFFDSGSESEFPDQD